MSKKLSLIIFILFLILGGVFGYLYFNSKSSSSSDLPSPISNSNGGGFPTGESLGGSLNMEGGRLNNATTSNSAFQNQNIFGGNQTSANNLRQIVNVPVAGATTYIDSRGQVVVRYLERETGHVQDQPILEKVPSKVTDTTIPKIFDAIFGKDGKFVVFQSFSGKSNNLNTAFAEIKKSLPATTSPQANVLLGEQNLSTTVGTLDGTLLPASVQSAIVSPDKTSYLYLNESAGGALGVVIPGDKTKLSKSLTTVFSSKLTAWTPAWPAKNTLTFTTKAGANLPGFMYRVNSNTKQKSLLLRNISGLLTSMSPDGQKILYSEGSGTGFTTHIYDVNSNTVKLFALRTLPEKCVWSNKSAQTLYCAEPTYIRPGKYPDDWYLGTVTFNDALWKINLVTGETKQLLSVSDNSTDRQDAIKLFYDEKEQNLFWINKGDSTVWGIPLGV